MQCGIRVLLMEYTFPSLVTYEKFENEIIKKILDLQ
jgi:hypothetical protein